MSISSIIPDHDLPQPEHSQRQELLSPIRNPVSLSDLSPLSFPNTSTFKHDHNVVAHPVPNFSTTDQYIAYFDDAIADHQPLHSPDNSSLTLTRRQERDLESEAYRMELARVNSLVSEYKQKYEETRELLEKKSYELDRRRRAFWNFKRWVRSTAALNHAKMAKAVAQVKARKHSLGSTTIPIGNYVISDDNAHESLSLALSTSS